eukprot:gene10643-10452_t
MTLYERSVRLAHRAYKVTLSPWTGRQCRFLPTCSDYGRDALIQHGPIKGGYLTVHRLVMIDLIFPDGSVRQYPEGSSGRDVAAAISKSLEKRTLLVRLDGKLIDFDRPLSSGKVEFVDRSDPDALDTIRHDTAHVLAEAVQELFPGTQVTIGPNVEDGFYYDFARNEPFSTDDFAAIEKKMREIVDRDEKIVREEWDRDEAIAHFDGIGESYKAQIIRDLPTTEPISVYRQGAWKDLCRGPHLPSTKHIGKAFKLTKLAGAYWRGDQNNAQLQRIYGTAWASEEDLA